MGCCSDRLTVSQALAARRAIKGFDPEHHMSDDEINQLLDTAILAPTAFNIQHWRIVLVTDPELRKQIREVAWNQPQTTDSSILLVLTMDLNAWKKEPQRYWRNAPQPAQDFILPAIQAYYEDKPQVQRDECMRSCGLLAMSIMLVAKEMGYDSCPMDGFDYDAVGKLIKLPDDHVIGMMVAVGKKTQDPYPKPGQLTINQVVVDNRFD